MLVSYHRNPVRWKRSREVEVQTSFLNLARHKGANSLPSLLPEPHPKEGLYLPGVDLSRLPEQLGGFPLDHGPLLTARHSKVNLYCTLSFP